MANPFQINTLGGFNLGGAVDDFRQEREAKQQQEQMQQLALGAAQGDANAIEQLFAVNPDLASMMEQRSQQRIAQQGAEQEALSQQAETDWGLKWVKANPEQRELLKQEALSNPLIDFDESDLEVGDPEANLAVNTMLYKNMGKDAYKTLLGGGMSGGMGGGATDGRTANIKDFEQYQILKRNDPAAAKEFGQKVGFITKEGRELTPYYQKRLSAYTDDSVKSRSEANKYEAMAGDFEKLDPTSGLSGTIFESLKQFTGSEDAVSALRKKYLAIRASQSVKNLPPGPASDKDIALALSGFPKETGNPEYMSSFLRGLSKLENVNAEYNEFKSRYLSDNGTERGMLDAWKGQTEDVQTGQLTPEEAAELAELERLEAEGSL